MRGSASHAQGLAGRPRIVAFLRQRRKDPQALISWRERNRHALREFWARAPADSLGVKQEFEKALAQDGKPTT